MAKLDTKNDLNRVGLFSELGYISIGDPFKRKSTGKIFKQHPWLKWNFESMSKELQFKKTTNST